MEIRCLIPEDFSRGFPQVLETFAPVNLTLAKCYGIFEERRRHGVETLVAVDDDRIVGTASFYIERKYIHDGGSVGHIEDVAVVPERQGKGIGSKLVNTAVRICAAAGCYKAILDCDGTHKAFYRKIGFTEWETQMRIELP